MVACDHKLTNEAHFKAGLVRTVFRKGITVCLLSNQRQGAARRQEGWLLGKELCIKKMGRKWLGLVRVYGCVG